MTLRSRLAAAAMCAAAGIVLSGCDLGLSQSAILLDTDSTSATIATTAPFTVTGPWQVKYNLDCTKANSEGVLNTDTFTIDAFNGDDNSTAFEHPVTTIISVKRQGVLNFTTPGRYYLHIDTQCDWTLQVIDLSGGPAPSTSPVPHIAQPTGAVALDVTFAAAFGPYKCDASVAGGSLCTVGDGSASTSSFGALTMHRTVVYVISKSACTTASTVGTLTAANGDVLNFQADKSEACAKSGVDSFPFTVTGGTGIFKGATGSGTITNTHITSDHWKGTITFPGPNSSASSSASPSTSPSASPSTSSSPSPSGG
jgi:hypothetical protein